MTRRQIIYSWGPTGLICVAVVVQPWIPQAVFLGVIVVAMAVMAVGLVDINRECRRIMAEADALRADRDARGDSCT